jgi:hypothetical protein
MVITVFDRVESYIRCGASVRELEALQRIIEKRLSDVRTSNNFFYQLGHSCASGHKMVKRVKNLQASSYRAISNRLAVLSPRCFAPGKPFERVLQEELSLMDTPIRVGRVAELAELYASLLIHHDYFEECVKYGFQILDLHSPSVDQEIPRYPLTEFWNSMDEFLRSHPHCDTIADLVHPIGIASRDLRPDLEGFLAEAKEALKDRVREGGEQILAPEPYIRPPRILPDRFPYGRIRLDLELVRDETGAVVRREDLVTTSRGRKRSLGDISGIDYPESINTESTQAMIRYEEELDQADYTFQVYDTQITEATQGSGPPWTDRIEHDNIIAHKRFKLQEVKSRKALSNLELTSSQSSESGLGTSSSSRPFDPASTSTGGHAADDAPTLPLDPIQEEDSE